MTLPPLIPLTGPIIIFCFDPFTFSVERRTMFRPKTEIAKSIISSAEPTHRLDFHTAGALSHSFNASTIILSIVELSSAWKSRFSSEILKVEKGNFDEIDCGKNDLSGILSLMLGIRITLPSFAIDSRKKLPGRGKAFKALVLNISSSILGVESG